MRLLDLADAPLLRTGEGTGLMAEELGFNQCRWQGGTINGDERPRARGPKSCSERATNSLPVPVSP